MTITYSVPGMTCGHCKSAIETEVGNVVGVSSVAVDLDAKTVAVVGGSDAEIRDAIDEAGFEIG